MKPLQLPLTFLCVLIVLFSSSLQAEEEASNTIFPANLTLAAQSVQNESVVPEIKFVDEEVIASPVLNSSKKAGVPAKNEKETKLLSWKAPERFRVNYPYALLGYDNEDRPIWLLPFGRWNFRNIVEAGDEEIRKFDRYMQQFRLRITKSRESRSTPENPINESVFLIDLRDMTMAQIASVPTLSYILKLARRYRKLLTEHTGAAVVVNANFIAETLINLVRPVFGQILEKTEIYGANRKRWLPQVIRHFPKDQLPVYYGGYENYQPVMAYG